MSLLVCLQKDYRYIDANADSVYQAVPFPSSLNSLWTRLCEPMKLWKGNRYPYTIHNAYNCKMLFHVSYVLMVMVVVDVVVGSLY